jgi:hypothetical protein
VCVSALASPSAVRSPFRVVSPSWCRRVASVLRASVPPFVPPCLPSCLRASVPSCLVPPCRALCLWCALSPPLFPVRSVSGALSPAPSVFGLCLRPLSSSPLPLVRPACALFALRPICVCRAVLSASVVFRPRACCAPFSLRLSRPVFPAAAAPCSPPPLLSAAVRRRCAVSEGNEIGNWLVGLTRGFFLYFILCI